LGPAKEDERTLTNRILLILIVVILVPPQAFAAKWHGTLEAAAAEAKKTNRMILVDMYADWCGWCKRFELEVYPSERFQAVAKNLVLLKLDTEDGKEGTDLARRWSVTSLPTFVMLTPDLVIAGYLRGYSPPAEFVRRIEEAESAWLEFRKRVVNEPKTATDAEKMALTAELMGRGDLVTAETRLKQHVTSSDSSVRDNAYHMLALLYRAQARFDLASMTAKKGLSLNGAGETAEQLQLLLAEIYMEQRNYKAALAEYKRFRTQFPGSSMIGTVNFIVPQLEAEIARQN
jgi:thioredoxin-related protein